ncbi:DNA-binding response regulator [Alteromonas sediminis]|uniref:DNA-binding response regulator n=1 Tax=Alteromonas sediminis TaxID=2259342 RepID=A0A3N5ZAF9_9ALTE|nr:response regulator transcription factor [Alteromonas sediminis]RPJ68084.1 DNA-binding response regulator [Alteromonas sediminis]
MNILLADDEEPLLKFLNKGLVAEGYTCTTLTMLHEVLPFVRKHTPDILVLDRLFGNEDSVTILPSIKSLPSPPLVLMLTALDEVNERVKGLQDGADDYLCKPFDFDELLARITALGRRLRAAPTLHDKSISVSNLTLMTEERVAHLFNKELPLTRIEFELLLYLAENQNKVLSRERILSRVWSTQSDPHTNIVDVYISRLRKKLANDTNLNVQTLRGNGYRLDCALIQ